MSYKLFDINGNEVNQGDLQKKEIWYEEGISFEQAFISKYGNALSLEINPEKKINRFTVDLLNTNTGNLGDLKTQTTPFFQSSVKYGIDPQYAVTFNSKDYIRFSKFYDNLELYFWIEWHVVKFEGKQTITVEPMNGVWMVSFDNLKPFLKNAPKHSYQQRFFDFRNNRESYVLDLNNPLFKRIV